MKIVPGQIIEVLYFYEIKFTKNSINSTSFYLPLYVFSNQHLKDCNAAVTLVMPSRKSVLSHQWHEFKTNQLKHYIFCLFVFRIRWETNGGAWCPSQPVSSDTYEFLQVDLGRLKVVTLVETQGRFGNGQVSPLEIISYYCKTLGV